MPAGDSITTVENTLRTNLGFDVNNSIAEARLCVVACREWLILRPGSMSNESSSLSLNVQQVSEILRRAEAYVVANESTAAYRRNAFASFGGGFRT